ncbi:MAG: alpha/beta hydrolase [Chlamydiota bacterium]
MFVKIKTLPNSNGELSYLGPSLDQGPLPALFYFALSAHDSLCLDPFNQPVLFMHQHFPTIRIFSMTIPGHEDNLPKENAINYWAENLQNGIDLISPFIKKVCATIDDLIKDHILIENKIAVAGLSRGAYIATLIGAKHPLCRHILGFAPLTTLNPLKEFQDLQTHPLLSSLNLMHHLDALSSKNLRYYIGTRDSRVGTHHAFHLITSLANYAYDHRRREGSFELMLGNSIGLMGHGTSSEVFKNGIDWVAKCLL